MEVTAIVVVAEKLLATLKRGKTTRTFTVTMRDIVILAGSQAMWNVDDGLMAKNKKSQNWNEKDMRVCENRVHAG